MKTNNDLVVVVSHSLLDNLLSLGNVVSYEREGKWGQCYKYLNSVCVRTRIIIAACKTVITDH